MDEEAEVIVTELLRELMMSVCIEESKTYCFTSNYSMPVDVYEVIRRSPEYLQGGFCERAGKWEVVQLECVDQKASGYCGHYAIYLSILCLQFTCCKSPNELLTLLEMTRSRVGFWKRYWMSIRVLLDYEKAIGKDAWWPWSKENILKGELERSYLTYLLTHDPSFTALDGEQYVSVIYFSYGCVQNSIQEVRKLQESIENFKKNQSYHVFIMGVTNHWVTLYAYHRTKTCDKQPNISLLYWDSNNISILSSSDTDIEHVVNMKEKDKVKIKGYGYRPWKRAVFIQSLCDQRDQIIMLSACLSGEKEFGQCVVSRLWKCVVNSFEKSVGEAEGDEFLSLLLQWLENDYRPRSLREYQVKMLMEFECGLDRQTQAKMLVWLKSCLKKLVEYCGGILLVDMFLSLLKDIKQHLSMHDDLKLC